MLCDSVVLVVVVVVVVVVMVVVVVVGGGGGGGTYGVHTVSSAQIRVYTVWEPQN